MKGLQLPVTPQRLTAILGIACVLLLIISVGSCSKLLRLGSELNKEKSSRFTAEEEATAYSREKAALEARLADSEREMESLKQDAASAKKMLTQEQLLNKSLKTELDKITKLKEALEADLRQAIATGGQPRR